MASGQWRARAFAPTGGRCPHVDPSPTIPPWGHGAPTLRRASDLHGLARCRATARRRQASPRSNTSSTSTEVETGAAQAANARSAAAILRSPNPARVPASRAALSRAGNAQGASHQDHRRPQAVAPSDRRPRSAAHGLRGLPPCAACQALGRRRFRLRVLPGQPTRNSPPRYRKGYPPSGTSAARRRREFLVIRRARPHARESCDSLAATTAGIFNPTS